MSKYLKENNVIRNVYMAGENLSWEMVVSQNQMEILKLKSTMSKMKNSLDYLNSRSDTAEKGSLNWKINQYILLNLKEKEKDFQHNKQSLRDL